MHEKGAIMDNRRAERWESSLYAEVYTRTEVMPASVENMGDDGLCLVLETAIQKDELVGVSVFSVDDTIEDPDFSPVNLPAKVVWCNNRQGITISAGMCFIDPPIAQ